MSRRLDFRLRGSERELLVRSEARVAGVLDRPSSVCEHCLRAVPRVWLVPGDVLDSCADCYTDVMGGPPVHEQGHTREQAPVRRPAASFFVRADGRRPA